MCFGTRLYHDAVRKNRTISRIATALIPAGGYGTRMLPFTKLIPKELLPLGTTPIIQHILEALSQAGIKDTIVVTKKNNPILKNYLTKNTTSLIEFLRQNKKTFEIKMLKKIPRLMNLRFIIQKGPYGSATPLISSKKYLKNTPFIYKTSDDLIIGGKGEFNELIKAYNKFGCSCLTVIKITDTSDLKKYGFIKGKELNSGYIEVENIVEKPGIGSGYELATVSSCLLTSDFMQYLEPALEMKGKGAEFYLNDVLKLALKNGIKIIGVESKRSVYLDLGNKTELLKSNVLYGLHVNENRAEFKTWLRHLINK